MCLEILTSDQHNLATSTLQRTKKEKKFFPGRQHFFLDSDQRFVGAQGSKKGAHGGVETAAFAGAEELTQFVLVGKLFPSSGSVQRKEIIISGQKPMGESSDFTFCQVGPGSEDDHLESPKTIPNIGNNLLGDGTSSNHISSCEDHLSDALRSVETLSSGPLKQPARVMKEPADELKELNLSERKPIVRSKVPFEKGYSQMDWLKLTRTHLDLAGLKGQSNRRRITMEEVRQHKTEGSVWTVLKGHVYNISPYMKFHPGGVDMLMKAAGKDCTTLFNRYHAWVNADFLLEKCLVGILEESQ